MRVPVSAFRRSLGGRLHQRDRERIIYADSRQLSHRHRLCLYWAIAYTEGSWLL